MKYMKPELYITEFEANQVIAACDRLVVGTETTTVYDEQSGNCIIGAQQGTVFNSGNNDCSTSATQWGIATSGGITYFVWFTYAGDMGNRSDAPSAYETELLNKLVVQIGGTTGSGWHYADVTGRDFVSEVRDYSY